MQVLVIAVQNVVPYADLGVATSGVTFFRSIGGSFGTAAFGAIFASQQGLTQLLGTWSAEHDAQLAGELQQLTIDLLRSPARLDRLLGVPAPPAPVP
jgi:hypothetical protein